MRPLVGAYPPCGTAKHSSLKTIRPPSPPCSGRRRFRRRHGRAHAVALESEAPRGRGAVEHTKAMKGWLEVAKECGCATPAECALFAAPGEGVPAADLALRVVSVDGKSCRRPPAG